MNLQTFKTLFDTELQKYILPKIEFAKKLLQHPQLEQFVTQIQDYIFSGGKRIRPYAMYLSYSAFGGQDEQEIIKFGRISETFHNMALIHDDIIDKSDKRHNVDTIHHHINKTINNLHISNGQAMLIGDLLLSRVYQLLAVNYNFSEPNLQQAKQNFHTMIEEVIIGEMIDVDMMLGNDIQEAHLHKKNLYKTARYTFARPMLTWAILAKVSAQEQKNIFAFGEELGLAFQIKDDLLDITHGDQSKSRFGDIQEGQQTYFTQYVFQQGSEKQKNILQKCLGKKLWTQEITQLQNIFEQSGAINYGEKLIQTHLTKAETIFSNITFPNQSFIPHFQTLIQKIWTQ